MKLPVVLLALDGAVVGGLAPRTFPEPALFGTAGATFHDDLRAVDALLKLGADPHRPFLFFDATMQASLSQVAATIRMAPRVIQALRDAEAQPLDDAAPSAPLPQMEIKCRACGTKQGRFRKCSRCKAAHYCSVECQKYDWQFHKRTCKPCVAAAMPASLSAGLASGRF